MAEQEQIKKQVDGFTGYRRNWVDAALPEEAHIQSIRSGGYQGQVAFVIRLDDYIWLFTDYYGSCSHCDNFIDRELSWLEDMLRKAYCFETEDDAIMYMAESNDFS